jgi:hypothetical protein
MTKMAAKAKKISGNKLDYQVSHRNGIKLHNNGDFIVFDAKACYNFGALKIAAILDSTDMKDLIKGKTKMADVLTHLETFNLIGALEFCEIIDNELEITFHAVHFKYSMK